MQKTATSHSRNRVAITGTATAVPLTKNGSTDLIDKPIVFLRLRNESGAETIYVQLMGSGAATAAQKDLVVLTPTSGAEHTRELWINPQRRTLSAIASGNANLTWEALYLE